MIKSTLTIIIAATLLFPLTGSFASAQSKNETQIVYTDASAFPVFGKAFEESPADTIRYQRLPQSFKKISRAPLWNLGLNSAGIFIRFRSDSPQICARWESLFKNAMNHMTDTGIRGLDLYTLVEGKWLFVRSGLPSREKVTTRQIIGNMEPCMREYMLYLSLYDGVQSLEIGVEKGYKLEAPAVSSPSTEKPVVMYGTSILQGGCASRPGMAFTNIIGRRLDKVVINLGFSGNGLLDYEIAELMAGVSDPGVFVLDYVPNANVQQINERGEKFFRIIRDKHPDVPILFLEDPIFPFSNYDKKILTEITKKNDAQRALFKKLKDSGEKKIYFMSSEDEIGHDLDATVDGIHFTDLGMERYTDYILPTLKKLLRK